MESYYDQLMNLKGADELKTIVNKWEILSHNVEKYSLEAPIVLPDLFVYTRPGIGNTAFLSLLAGYLDSNRLLKYIDFSVKK